MSWEREDGWNKKPGARRPRDRARHAKNDGGSPADPAPSTWETSRRKSEKRQHRRRVSWIIGSITLTLVILVMLAPMIAGALAPGIVASKGSAAIAGRVEVDAIRLSWFGAQRIEGLRLYDTQDTRRSDLSITADKGLLALAFAGGDFGTVTVSGTIDASENEQGEPFTAHTVGPAKPSAAPPPAPTGTVTGPPALPRNLRATLAFDNLSIRYARPGQAGPIEAITLENLGGTARVDTTGESVVDLDGHLTRRRAGEATFERAGKISIDAMATGLTDADGTLTPDAIGFDATINATDIETAIADLFTGGEPPVGRALGPTVTLNTTANGSAKAFTTTVTVNSAGVRAEAPLAIDLAARTITGERPVTARLDTERLSFLVPDRDALLGEGAPVRVTAFPAIDLTIDSLRAPIPEAGAPLRLDDAGAVLTAQIGRLAARLDDPATGAERTVGFEPATIILTASDLAQPATLSTRVGTMIDGAASGTLAIDLTASGLLDDAGSFNTTDLPAIEGAINAESLALTAFQPIAQALGFDLVGTLGDTADLAINASPAADGTTIAIDGAAPRARIAGTLALAGGAITTTGDPLTLRLDRPDAALAPFLADSGIAITDASGLTLTLAGLRVDLDRIGAGDLSTLSADLGASLDRLGASIPGAGQPVAIRSLTASVRTGGLASGVDLRAHNDFLLSNEPAGTIDASFTAADLLDANGAIAPGIPANIRGTLTLDGVRTAALGAFVPIEQLDLPTDLGPTLDATLALAPAPGSTPAEPRAAVDLRIASANLNGTGALVLARDRVTGADNALNLTLTNAGPLLERFAPAPAEGAPPAIALHAQSPGTISVRARDLDLPLDPATMTTGGRAQVVLSIADLALAGMPDPASAQDYAGTIRQFDLTTRLAPGADPVITLDGSVFQRRAGVTTTGLITGEITLANAFTPFDDRGNLLLAPNGSVRVRDLPVAFARLLPVAFPAQPEAGVTPISLEEVLTRAVGQAASVAITLSRATDPAKAASAPIEIALDTDAGAHTIDASVSLAPRTTGGFEPADLSADANITLDDPTFRAALAVGAPKAPASMRITEPGSLVVKVRNDRGTLRADATVKPATIAGLAATDGRALSPIALAGTAGATLPMALLADPAGTHPVTMTADFTGTETAGGERKVLTLVASAEATLANSQPTGGAKATVRAGSQEPAWVDALSGLDGLLTAALGDRFDLRADLDASFDPAKGPMPTRANASATMDAPLLRTATPARVTIADETLRLGDPAAILWTITPALFEKFAPVEPGKAAQLALAAPVDLSINARTLALPLGGTRATPEIAVTADADSLPLRFADGSSYRLVNLGVRLDSMRDAGKGKLVVSASSEDKPDAKIVTLDATVAGLPTGEAAFDPANIALDGVAKIDDLPMQLVDALASANGAAVIFLGGSLYVDQRGATRPRAEGTISFRATTPQANARYAATVRPHPAHPDALAVIADEPVTAEITHFHYDLEKDAQTPIPIFGYLRKVEKTHRPASVRLTRLVTPVDGDPARIDMLGTVDPGVVEYDLERTLGALLKFTGLRNQSEAGQRIQPFEVSMRDNIVRFDKLNVPVGEFVMKARGSFDYNTNTEDIVLGIPAGAFAAEVIRGLPGAVDGVLREAVVIPVRRHGPIGGENEWKPDPGNAEGQLFDPKKILDEVINRGLNELFKKKDGG